MTAYAEPMTSTFTSSPEYTPNSSFGTYEFAISGTSARTELEISNSDDTELINVSWNQDYSCFAAGTSSGFRIYGCDPFKETFRRDLKNGGFGIVEMLFRCNILALVGCGGNSQYSPNKVMIWDDHQGRCIGEFSFRSEVRAVKLRRDRIVVILEHKIYIYNFLDLKLLHQIETLSNPRGLCCLSHHLNTFALACPGRRRGQVRVEHFGLNLTKFIQAHDSQIACFTLTMDGLLLATASVKGTLIRVFNTMDGTCLQEVRRGTEKADIYDIAFSPNVQWLAVSSDKGTVHIFSLRVRVTVEDASARTNFIRTPSLLHQNSSSSVDPLISPDAGANPSSSLSFMKDGANESYLRQGYESEKINSWFGSVSLTPSFLACLLLGVLPKYFSSEWSFARFHLSECARSIVGFGAHNTVNIVTLDGSFYKCKFDPVNGGEMSQVDGIQFVKSENWPR